MAVISQPNLLPGEFASDGDKNTIPANNDGLSGLASIAKGFPPITQQPLASGGLPPQRADFNGIFNLISQFLLYYQSGGVCSYNTTLDYNPPAIVGDAEGNIYMCIAQNGPNTSAGEQDTTNTSYWLNIANENTLKDYLLLSGGTMTGIVNLFAGSTIPTADAGDNSKKIVNSEWVQAWVKSFVSELSTNLQVETQEDGHFSCPALGITGLRAQNGYICLGKLFGGLILQWGLFETNAVKNTMQRGTITYAISFSSFGIPFGMLSGYNGIDTRSVLTLENKTKNNFVWVVYTNSAETIMPNNGYFAIGV